MIILIGFLKLSNEENQRIDLLAQFAYARKVPFCHFTLRDAEACMRGDRLHALRWNGDGYEAFETDFPPYVDMRSTLFDGSMYTDKDREIIKWIKSNARVLIQYSLLKDKLMHALVANGLGKYAIPSFPVSGYQHILALSNTMPNALIKPVKGKQGAFVYKLTKQSDGKIYAEDRSGRHEFTEKFCESVFSNVEACFGGEIIMQPFLDFRYDDNHVLDFRLFRHRGADGSWEDVATFGRIGSNAITSNFHTGGSMIEADMALRAIAPEKADELLEEIMMLGRELPVMIEKYGGENVFCIGFDVAVDRQTLQPYVMESNITPGLRFIIYQYTDHRVNYYKYLESKLK